MSAAAGLRLEPAFATPIVVGYLPESAELARELEPIILERRGAAAGVVRSNVGGWHSDTNMATWGGEPMRRLLERVVTIADANTEDSEEPARGRSGWILEAWANVNEPGASNAAHAHPGCFWSAVFYVRAGEGEGGEIVFHDPRLPFLNMHAPALRFRDFGAEGELVLRPEPGMLLLFPAWLSHGVQPWTGEGLRISVAINLSARQRHAAIQ